MPEGTVKFFSSTKGYGFVVPDEGGDDCFVYWRSVQMDGYKTLAEGQRVRFSVVETEKGRQATEVEPL